MANAKVMTRGATGNYSRLAFEGPEDKARAFIIANFPRVHVEPGSNDTPEPDAQLVIGSRKPASWDGVAWSDAKPDSDSAAAGKLV